jgi:hypothetical protein
MSESTEELARESAIYRYLAGAATLLVATGTVAYRLLEDWSWVDSLYFSVVAVTTVGFGDITPSNDASKLFTVAYILVGISLIAAYLNVRMKVKASRVISITQGDSKRGIDR